MNTAQALRKINMFCGDDPIAHQTALALQKAKILNYYITSAVPKNKETSLAELDASLLIRYPWPEILRSTLHRLRVPGSLHQKAASVCGGMLDNYVSRHFLDDVNAILGFSGLSVKTFREAKTRGINRVLSQKTASAPQLYQALREEAELHPDFAETFDEDFKNPEWLRLRNEEAQLADAILCGSYFAKQSFEPDQAVSGKTQVVPYGVDCEMFRCPRGGESFFRDNTIRILFAGPIGQQRGIKYLLEAVKQIGNKKIQLTLAGNLLGPKSVYKPYAGWFRHILRRPYGVTRDDYAQADLLILPAISEGFGLEVLEAMASGIPVIVSENTGAKDVVEDWKEGFVVPARNTEILKEKILYFYESPVKLFEMGARAVKKAEHYSWLYYQSTVKRFFEDFLSVRM